MPSPALLTATKFHSTLADGTPNAGGKLYTYAAGTTTPQASYTTAALTTPNTNPVILDGTGRASVWLDATKSYKFVITDAAGAATPDGTVDNWQDSGGLITQNLAGTSGASYVGYLAPGTAAVARTLRAKEYERGFSVLDFGAVPDADYSGAGTDSTAAFQAAIEAAWAAANTAGTTDFGGRVYVPAGNYKITDTITLRPMVNLVGDGKYLSSLIVPTNFTAAKGVIYSNASTPPYSGAASLPNIIRGLNVSTVTGGLSGVSYGIYIDKNATFVDDVWVSGFLNGGSGIVNINTDVFVSNFVVEYCTYGLNVGGAACNFTDGTVYLCDYGVLLNNSAVMANEASPCVFSNIRANVCNFSGFEVLTGGKRASFVNCSAAHINNSKFSKAGFYADGGVDLTIIGFRATLDNAGTTPSTTATGIYLKSCTAVTVSGGIAKGWLNGYVIEAGADNGLDGVEAYGNKDRGIYINGGDQHQVSNAVCAVNGLSAGLGIGIESSNTASSSTHQIIGCMCQGTTGGVQNVGIKAALTDNGVNTGQTYISGGTNCHYNNTANYQLSGRIDRIFTEGSFPTARALQSVASAATITIPPSAANGGVVIVTGTTNITSITATGYEGARVTLVFPSALTVTDGSNLRLNGNFVTTVDDTISLVCDGTLWYETSRSPN